MTYPVPITTLFVDIGGVLLRVPHLGTKGAKLKTMLKNKLIEHKAYIDKNGLDMSEILNWRWK